MTLHLDTHVALWLYAGEVERIPPGVRERLEREELVISPLVELELTFLQEVGRTRIGGAEIVSDLGARLGLRVSDHPHASVVRASLPLSWTRDPFDRLIVGQAIAEGCELLTKDRRIRAAFEGAVWG